ncbi:MAG: hypothetical protein HY975_04390 [Candidatus Kerfeldbacteria bacterium]|nr:hypothetical protein [Candidatus Kerfeldbacteria bacterium]
MKTYYSLVIAASLICWILEGCTNWAWPIGATGTGIAAIGLGSGAFMWWIKHQATLTQEEYNRRYLDRKVEQHQDGNIIG